jgi:hypothetical protein
MQQNFSGEATMRKTFVFAAAIVSALLLASCAAEKRLMEPLPQTFLENADLSKQIDRLPFEHAWKDPKVDIDSYKGVYVKPVRTDLLPMDKWINSASPFITSEADYSEEAKKLATYFRDQIMSEIEKRSGQRLANLEPRPGKGVAVMEIALTELEYSHPVAQAGALASPVPGTGVAVSAVSDPYVSFAMRVTDGGSGKLIATAADRKYAPNRILDLNKLTATSTNREICGDWATEIADAISTDALTSVSGNNWKVKPW